jgi:hypothetical protein
MTRRLAAFAFALVLAPSLFGSSPGRAETAGYTVGPFRSGMKLADLRAAAWPAGSRLLCHGDSDLPAKLDSPPQGGIVLPPRYADTGLVPCALFAPDADGTWKMSTMDFAGAPATVWVLAVVDKAGSDPLMVQAKLDQPDSAFKATLAFVTGLLGPAQVANQGGSRWLGDSGDVLVGHTSAGGVDTVLTDKRLEKVVSDRIAATLPKKPATPKAAP